ncbi:MAG TPA: hypothetical protein DCL76_06575 [Chloroflexi bacterium]|nr:hypothetical protein [Chloroflexota bacterium]
MSGLRSKAYRKIGDLGNPASFKPILFPLEYPPLSLFVISVHHLCSEVKCEMVSSVLALSIMNTVEEMFWVAFSKLFRQFERWSHELWVTIIMAMSCLFMQ